jgi:hypothetical protein
MRAMARSTLAAMILLMVSACATAPTSRVTTQVPLSEGQRHIYWGDETLDWNDLRSDPHHYTATIGGANLDGSGVDQAFVTGMQGICGVAVGP